MKLSLIVAMTPSGVIGKDGKLPWDKIHEDMANFRRLTMGHGIIMGRRTFESLPKPLEGRRNIILSRTLEAVKNPFAKVVHSPTEAIVEAFESSGDEAFVIGGAEIYRLLGPLCDDAHVTLVDRHVDGDTEFPLELFDSSKWDVADEKQLAASVSYSHMIRKPCPKPTTPAI